jgi:hypothetical protein
MSDRYVAQTFALPWVSLIPLHITATTGAR